MLQGDSLIVFELAPLPDQASIESDQRLAWGGTTRPQV
jgi:hypothetical protein